MIEAVIELRRNMMDVEASARESRVNPLQAGRQGPLEGGNDEDVRNAVSAQLSECSEAAPRLQVVQIWN